MKKALIIRIMLISPDGTFAKVLNSVKQSLKFHLFY